MSENYNFNINGEVITANIDNYEKPAIKELLKNCCNHIRIKPKENGQQKDILILNKKTFAVDYFEDTASDKEKTTKRIQSSIISLAQAKKCDLLIAYPIPSSNELKMIDCIFAIWEYKDFKNIEISTKKNISFKVKLDKIYKKAFPNKPLPKKLKRTSGSQKQLLYEFATYFTKQQFIDYINFSTEINKIKDTAETNIISSEEAMILQYHYIRNSNLQAEFRKNLINDRNCKCQLCSISKKELLIASHIYPVKAICNNYSNNLIRVKLISDTQNGLLLCPVHDKLFDLGYISFEKSGQIIISKSIQQQIESLDLKEDMNINPSTFNFEYMDYHNKNIFKDGVK